MSVSKHAAKNSKLRKGEIIAKITTGIEEAVSDYQRLNEDSTDSPHYGALMVNTDTMKVWTDELYDIDHDTSTEYDKGIINPGHEMESVDLETTVENVKAYIEKHIL